MYKKLAFVLSGGGSRGAMQAGALRALLEAGYQPDLVTGTSIGAANAAFLAVHGFSPQGIQQLEGVWHATVSEDLLPDNLWWQAMRLFFRRQTGQSWQRIRDFAIAHGLTPDLRFKDILGVKLFLVAADLNAGCPVVFGLDPNEAVLEGVLASLTLPPWMAPQEKKGRFLMDGAAVSNLPIETALQVGAEEIIALDLFNPHEVDPTDHGLGALIWKLNQTVENRQLNLEMELAEARGVTVRHIALISEPPVAMWDFRQSVELIELGYTLARQAIDAWPPRQNSDGWRLKLRSVLEGLIESME